MDAEAVPPEAILEANITNQGLIIYVDRLQCDGDGGDEPMCIEDLNLGEQTIVWKSVFSARGRPELRVGRC